MTTKQLALAMVAVVAAGCGTLDLTPKIDMAEINRNQAALETAAAAERAKSPVRSVGQMVDELLRQALELEKSNADLKGLLGDSERKLTDANEALVALRKELATKSAPDAGLGVANATIAELRTKLAATERARDAALKAAPGKLIERGRILGRDVLIYEAPPDNKK